MKRTFLVLSMIAMGALVFGSSGEAQMQHEHPRGEKIEKTQGDEVVCPVTDRVMKRAEAPASYTLYFVSEAAMDAFLKNPAKFLTAACPVMGGEANKLTATYSNYDGVAYHFCCAGCKEIFEKEPKKYIGKAQKKSEIHGHSEMNFGAATGSDVMGNTGYMGCSSTGSEKDQKGHSCGMSHKSDATKGSAGMADPVCGMKVSSKDGVHSEFHGKEYYFCSTQCQEKFEKAPEDYIKR